MSAAAAKFASPASNVNLVQYIWIVKVNENEPNQIKNKHILAISQVVVVAVPVQMSIV